MTPPFGTFSKNSSVLEEVGFPKQEPEKKQKRKMLLLTDRGSMTFDAKLLGSSVVGRGCSTKSKRFQIRCENHQMGQVRWYDHDHQTYLMGNVLNVLICREGNASATAARACATKLLLFAAAPHSFFFPSSSFSTTSLASTLLPLWFSSSFSSLSTFPPPADNYQTNTFSSSSLWQQADTDSNKEVKQSIFLEPWPGSGWNLHFYFYLASFRHTFMHYWSILLILNCRRPFFLEDHFWSIIVIAIDYFLWPYGLKFIAGPSFAFYLKRIILLFAIRGSFTITFTFTAITFTFSCNHCIFLDFSICEFFKQGDATQGGPEMGFGRKCQDSSVDSIPKHSSSMWIGEKLSWQRWTIFELQ